MNFFTVTLFLALGVTAFGYTYQPTLDNLVEALDTRNKIWLAWRSYERETSRQNHRCNYVLKTAQQGLFKYEFNQYFKYGQEWDDQYLYVDINRGGEDLPVLTIRNSTRSKGVLYTMRFWDAEHHCFVLTATLNGQFECELHLWDQDVQEQETPDIYYCMQDFERLCRGRKYQLYSQQCKA